MKENKCSYCQKEFPPQELICFGDQGGAGGHYCEGEGRNHRGRGRGQGYPKNRRDCCDNPSNYPLFLCRNCYNSYQERKQKTIQRNKEEGRTFMIIATPFLIVYLVFLGFWVTKKLKKKHVK